MSENNEKIVLYSYWRSSCSWRVRIALELKGLSYEYVAVNLIANGGEQLQPEYAKLNPGRKVPTLLMDGNTLNQSLAICEYVDETHSERNPLLPRGSSTKDAGDRANIRALCLQLVADTQPLQNLHILNKVAAIAGPANADAKNAWAKEVIEKGLAAFETMVRTYASRSHPDREPSDLQFCYGDALSLADLCLVPQLYNGRRFGVDVDRICPACVAIDKHLATIPEFIAAAPDAQPDKPSC
eukprot:ANDGO_05226.mRNA.1 Maleylacetoacetate isomerase